MKQCPNCNKVNPDNAKICCYCGTSIDYTQTEYDSSCHNGYNQQQQTFDQQYQTYQHNQTTYNPNFNAEEYYCRNNAFDIDQLGKSRGIAALLAIFLGGLGVHYFYMGKIIGGLITIALSAITCGAWSILNFVQGIVLLCSDNYYFDRKFIFSSSTFPLF